MRRSPLIAIVAFAFFSLCLAAQNLIVDVNFRTLELTVEDESGMPVLGLTKDDFEIVDGGKARPVSHLEIETEPAVIGLLVDRSSSIAPVRKKVDDAVTHVVKAASPGDQLFLMTFASRDDLAVTLTTAHDKVLDTLARGRLSYGTRVYDAITASLAYLATSASPRRALIIFSDGADHYSRHSFEQVLERALQNDIEVYVIGYAGDDNRTRLDEGWSEVRSQFSRLAKATGGNAFFPAPSISCGSIARGIVRRTKSYYRLGFYLPEAAAGTDVEVKLRGPGTEGLKVRRAL